LQDNFELALKHIPDATKPISDGVRAIHRQLNALLAKHGVTPFESLGERFNPDLHEALAAVESEQHESETVIDELRRGYRSGNTVLRHAQVFVAKGADPTCGP
jgi:molecular chaperone GrpE